MLRDKAQDCSPVRSLFSKEVLIKNDSSPPGLTLLGISLLSDPALVSAILPENHTLYEIIRNVMTPCDQRSIIFFFVKISVRNHKYQSLPDLDSLHLGPDLKD